MTALLDTFKRTVSLLFPGKPVAALQRESALRFNPNEKRNLVRHKMRMREGYVYWPSRPGYQAQACTIKDVSVTGASIQLNDRLDDETLLSSPMVLYCTVEKKEYPCTTSWRKGSLIGIKYDGGPRPTTRRF